MSILYLFTSLFQNECRLHDIFKQEWLFGSRSPRLFNKHCFDKECQLARFRVSCKQVTAPVHMVRLFFDSTDDEDFACLL